MIKDIYNANIIIVPEKQYIVKTATQPTREAPCSTIMESIGQIGPDGNDRSGYEHYEAKGTHELVRYLAHDVTEDKTILQVCAELKGTYKNAGL